MISPPVETSGAVGQQWPRVSSFPEYVSSAGPEAIELAALAGLHLDPWQQLILTHALGERANGRWAAFEVGLVVPRQNGKGSILEARELAGLFLFGEKLLIHSAHEQATSSEHYRRLLQLIESVPEFDQRVLRAPKGKGMEAIELRGGQRIFFKTRTSGGGRGLTGDFVALDEAMIVPEATTAALVPTMAARSISGNPQLWYAGSAVDQQKHEHGVVLARVRDRGMRKVPRVAYFEHSAPGDDPSAVPAEIRTDPKVWGQANPGMGIRTSEEHIENECAGAMGPREFAVERLGIGDWPTIDEGGDQVIAAKAWTDLVDADSGLLDPVCFAYDVTPDRSSSSISAAGVRADGLWHVEVIERRAGTAWLGPRLVELTGAHESIAIMYAASSPAASLAPGLLVLELDVRPVSDREHAEACGLLFDAVTERTLRHLNDLELAESLKGARKRAMGDASWAWSRKSSKIDISPVIACTLALWGSHTQEPPAPPPSFEWVS